VQTDELDDDPSVDQLAERAGDPSVPMGERLEALFAVGRAVAASGAVVPAAALDAVGDAAVIDAALEAGAAAAITGVLFGAPDDRLNRSTRILVGRRLMAAGVRGAHVTRLLIDARDWEAAVRAAADDYLSNINVLASNPDSVASAWAVLAISWRDTHPDLLWKPLIAEIEARDPDGAETLQSLVAAISQTCKTAGD
jgi:hypothetical protein